MSKTIENSCLEAAETLQKIAKNYFKLAKLEPRFEEHYNLEAERTLKLAKWYFNRSKTNVKFSPSENATGAGRQQPAGSVSRT